MAKFISISGTHCSGKTTLVTSLKEKFKEDSSVAFIPSTTRVLREQGYPINNSESSNYDNTQLACVRYDLLSLIQARSLSNEKEVIFFDRTLLDTVVYTNYLYKEKKVSREVFELCNLLWVINRDYYSTIVIPDHSEIKLISDNFRTSDKRFQVEVDNEFVKLLGPDLYYSSKLKGTEIERLENLIQKLKK